MNVLTREQIKAVRSTMGLNPDLRVKYKVTPNGTYTDMYNLFDSFYMRYLSGTKVIDGFNNASSDDVIKYWINQVYRGVTK